MIIRFKLGQYDDILEEYNALFEYADLLETDEQDGNVLLVRGWRVVVPQIHASFREASWVTRNEEVNDPADAEAWIAQDSVYVLYDENEKDINMYISYMNGSLGYFIMDACIAANSQFENKDDLDCFIDTSEFVDEKTVKRMFSNDWKKAIEEKYPEFFEAIHGQSYKIYKSSDTYAYDAEVWIHNNVSGISVMIGKPFYYQYCQWFAHESSKDPDQTVAYLKMIDFIKSIVNNEVFGIICFVDGRKHFTETFSMTDLPEMTTDRVFQELQAKYPVLREKGHRIVLRWCFWDGPKREDDRFIS